MKKSGATSTTSGGGRLAGWDAVLRFNVIM